MKDTFFQEFGQGQTPANDNPREPSVSTVPGEARIAPVPQNLLGTDNALLLQMAQDAAGTFRAWEVMEARVPIRGKFDADHLRNIHAHVMKDIFAEPGATRGDELLITQIDNKRDGKPMPLEYDTRMGMNDEKITLLSAGKVNGRLDELGRMLAEENTLGGMNKPAFVEKLADYYLRYSHAAPFQSGNEHVLGVVLQQIGVEAGYEVRPGSAKHLREVTDRTLEAGVASDKSSLILVLSSVTTEGKGIEAEARRNPTQWAIPLVLSDELKKRQAEEDIGQAGSKLLGRVGGQEKEDFKASMRAIIAGDAAPQHINVVRTTALKYGGPELAGETKRIEENASVLDNYRREEQRQGRQNDQARVVPRQTEQTPRSEITR